MSQLTITLSDELEEQVRNYVREHDYNSISDFTRESLAKAISEQPSYWDRTFLVNLMEIKQHLGEDINEELLDALRNGYPNFYSLKDYSVTKNELSKKDTDFVFDVLDMYADLQHSYDVSIEKDSKIEKDIIFEGFDGNAGDGHLGYLQFLVKHGRYTYVKPLDKGHAINSHSHVTSIYERMLYNYKSIKRDDFDRRPLTLDEIRLVVDGRIHPENR